MKSLIEKSFFVLFILCMLPLQAAASRQGGPLFDCIKGRKLSQPGLSNWIIDMVIMKDLDEVDKWRKIYPESFQGLDLCEGYYDAGLWFYNSSKKMLALKSFLKGTESFQDSPYKRPCMLYAARIFYRKNNRESALYYVDRILETEKSDASLLNEARKLKRRISWEYIDSSEGLPDNSISALEFDGDDLWIGTWTGGVCRFTRSSHKLAVYRACRGGLSSDHVRCIAVDDRKVWVGTYDGLCCFDKKTETWAGIRIAPGAVTVKKLKIQDGVLYAATLSGLYTPGREKGTWRRILANSFMISDFLFDKGTLYAATLDRGLFIIKDGSALNILTGLSLKSICFHDGLLWVGTHGNGIYIISGGKIAGHLTSTDGLASDYVESVKVMKDDLFLGTLGGGVMIYNFTKQNWSFINVLSGLPGNDVVNISFEKDRVWFGTLSGGIGILLTQNNEI